MTGTEFYHKGIKLLCGDHSLLRGVKDVDLVFTSPPYNIGSASPKKLKNRKGGEFDTKSFASVDGYPDNLPEPEYQDQQRQFLVWCSKLLSPKGSVVYNHKNRNVAGALISPHIWFPHNNLTLTQEIIWDRRSTHNHTSRYVYNHHENLYVFSVPGRTPYFVNQDMFWKTEKNKGVGSVWVIPREENIGHCAPFPLRLARQVIRMWCPPGGLVCDPYSGSGTTMLAAFLEGRSFIGCEKQEKYFDLSVTRFKEHRDLNCVRDGAEKVSARGL